MSPTLCVFVQVCDVLAFAGAHCLGADEVAYSFLLTVDLAESAIQVALPVDLITVHLRTRRKEGKGDMNLKPYSGFNL